MPQENSSQPAIQSDVQSRIIEFLKKHNSQAFYIDIRDDLMDILESENAFDEELEALETAGKIHLDDETKVHLISA